MTRTVCVAVCSSQPSESQCARLSKSSHIVILSPIFKCNRRGWLSFNWPPPLLSSPSIHKLHAHCESTLVRKNLLRVSLADFPFDSASFAAALGSSLGAALAGLAADSALFSARGGSGGGGGGTGIPLGAAGGSDTTCMRESKCERGALSDIRALKGQSARAQSSRSKMSLVCEVQEEKIKEKRWMCCSQWWLLPVRSPSDTIRQHKKEAVNDFS